MSDPTRSAAPPETLAPPDGSPPAGVAADPPGFELKGEVGRGGMGVVYRAYDRAMRREVAVKVLQDKFAPDSGTAYRFVEEACITGQLQHPGIPAVYQVGRFPDGRPFLAMKLIKGETLDALLASRERERPEAAPDPLAVFEAIAQAVGYAHAHGVIHRDLKPQNVMVGAFGEVQVMDWGLAKLLGELPRVSGPSASPDSDATTAPTAIQSGRESDGSFTQAGSILGTPAFMPPEQAAGELDKIDTRSDVFGLGAILCVLLTGKPPFDGKDAEAVRLNAVRGRTEAALARLDGCGADPDVVALCKRCLAFEPADRPASANDLAAAVVDLRRAADDRAKQAERDKLAAEVRAGEQTKRRRVIQLAALAVAAVLAIGVSVSVWQAAVARREAAEARTARGTAEEARQAEAEQKAEAVANEATATATLQFFQDHVFAAARPKQQDGGLGHDVTLKAAITASLPELGKRFASQPLAEARLRNALGTTFTHLGEPSSAVEQFERARDLLSAKHGPAHPDALRAATTLANAYIHANRYPAAVGLCEAAEPDVARAFPADHPDRLQFQLVLARSYFYVHRHTDAARLGEATLAGCRRALPPDHPRALETMHSLAIFYTYVGRYADACRLNEETLAAFRRVHPPDHPETLLSMHNLAAKYYFLERFDDALRMYREALAGRVRVLPPDHPHTLANMWGVAVSLAELGRGAEAVPIIDECVRRAAGKVVDPFMVPYLLEARLIHFQTVGDAAGCRKTAEMWENTSPKTADDLYRAAGNRAVAAAVFTKANRPVDATADADRAMDWLAKAVAAGYDHRAQIEQDRNLAALRGRPDFRALVGAMAYTIPPPHPVR